MNEQTCHCTSSMVVSDAELLAEQAACPLVVSTRTQRSMVLRPGVGTNPWHAVLPEPTYLWPDAEGITSSLVLLATSAAGELAAHYLAVGDIEGVFWAKRSRGWKVLAGHEELIAR